MSCSCTGRFLIGATIKTHAYFQDLESSAVMTPTTVEVRVWKPDGTELTPGLTPTNPETGHYVASFDTDMKGKWCITWVGIYSSETVIRKSYVIVDEGCAPGVIVA